ncbi:hypothetical protein CHARACLAT_003186 [Characodon lateralis]|uniref:Uncharacterized protein n=1 Tax=Characodon lateralis TaxID=208331 RepID=A0ABU7DXW8_9TELE|nr:hypothetical protein [Characodon lateralis]
MILQTKLESIPGRSFPAGPEGGSIVLHRSSCRTGLTPSSSSSRLTFSFCVTQWMVLMFFLEVSQEVFS